MAELVMFDLVGLGGTIRVGGFLGAGFGLLVAGVRYPRIISQRH